MVGFANAITLHQLLFDGLSPLPPSPLTQTFPFNLLPNYFWVRQFSLIVYSVFGSE